MKTKYKSLLEWVIMFTVIVVVGCQAKSEHGSQDKDEVVVWLTNADQSVLFEKQPNISFGDVDGTLPAITIDESKTFQEMDGFGYTLTGGSAMHIYRMDEEPRSQLLQELFATDSTHIGISYLRLSIGASDLDERPFSYNDLPEGMIDPEMEKFNLDPDRKYLIPVLKEILAINPDIKIMGSPWSPPTWMKTNNDTKGGSLKPEYYAAYAKYFVRYIQEMAAEGIRIDAVTIQNEPLHPGNNPSLLMLEDEMSEFIKDHLGPAFETEGITTKIIIYDHNADRPDYPITILNDPETKKYVDGTAFHLYGGTIDALMEVHNAHPDKHLYFTEQWIGAPGDFPIDLNWHTKNLVIGATRNWCKTVLEWNLAADPHQDPHTDRGGCDRCLGAITIDGNTVIRNPAYYIMAHASKFVRPGAVRIETNMPERLPNVAFKGSQGHIVLIVLNDAYAEKTFNITFNGKTVTTFLNGGAVGTYIWP